MERKFEELEKSYNEIEKGKAGLITSGSLAFAFGRERAAEILQAAVEKRKRIKIVYGSGDDQIKEILFVRPKS